MSKINAGQPQALSNLKLNQPELGDSLAKQGFSLSDPALNGAAAGAAGLDAATLNSIAATLTSMKSTSVGPVASAHAPGAPLPATASKTGYTASLEGAPATPKSAMQKTMMAAVGLSMQQTKESMVAIAGYDAARTEAVTNGEGKSTAGIPLSELSVADVLNDPNLSFEELLFKFMAVVSNEQQNKVLEKMREIEALGSGDKAAGTGDSPEKITGDVSARTAGDQGTGAKNWMHNISDGLRGADPAEVSNGLKNIGGLCAGLSVTVGPALAATGPWGAAAAAALPIVAGACFAGAIAVDLGGLDLLADGLDALGGDRASKAKTNTGSVTAAKPQSAAKASSSEASPPPPKVRDVAVPSLGSAKELQNASKAPGGEPRRVTSTSARHVSMNNVGQRYSTLAGPKQKPVAGDRSGDVKSATGGKETYDPQHLSDLVRNHQIAQSKTSYTEDLRTTHEGKTAVEWKEELDLYTQQLQAGDLFVEGQTVLPDNTNGPDPKEVSRLTGNMARAAAAQGGTFAGKTAADWQAELDAYKSSAAKESGMNQIRGMTAQPMNAPSKTSAGANAPTSAPTAPDGGTVESPPSTEPASTQPASTQPGATQPGSSNETAGSEESRAIMMEELKFMTQQLSQMMQAMSGVLNASHESAMNTIRNIK